MSMGNYVYEDSSYDTFLTLNRDMIWHLLGDEGFAEAFVRRWAQLRESIWSDDAILGMYDAMVDYMAVPAAQDAQRWPAIEGEFKSLSPESYTTTWEEETARTREWLVRRLAWLDANIPLLENIEDSPLLSEVESAGTWAMEALVGAQDAGLIPVEMAGADWRNETLRLDAARAMVLLIEKASGKTRDQIASENGWDLDANHFTDTDDKDVTFLRYAGVVTGAGGVYYPEGSFTRIELVAMLTRAAENLFGFDTGGTHSFPDVPDWASPYVAYVADNGITKGNAGRFNPNGRLTNQETMVFIYRTYLVWT
jgi:hypothetical protein